MLAKDSILHVTNLVSMDTFGEWINGQLTLRGWSQADLARATGMDSAVISNLINNRRGAGADSCKAIASALKIPPEIVMRAAGLLPPVAENTQEKEHLNYLYSQLKKEGQEDLVTYARFLLEKQERSA